MHVWTLLQISYLTDSRARTVSLFITKIIRNRQKYIENADFLIFKASSKCGARLRFTRILGSIDVIC